MFASYVLFKDLFWHKDGGGGFHPTQKSITYKL